jgi:hypothetical protein
MVRKLLISNDDHPVLPVGLHQVDQHPILAGRRHVLADVVGPDRQLPVPAVDQDREPDRRRTPELESASIAARAVLPV